MGVKSPRQVKNERDARQKPRICPIPVVLFAMMQDEIQTGKTWKIRKMRWDRETKVMQAVTQTNTQNAVVLPTFDEALPLILKFAPNWPARTLMFRIIGTALVLSASGMWLMPGSQYAPDVVLIKLGASLFFFLCGLALLMRNHEDNQPDAYFDPIRSEVRVLQKNNRGRPQTVLRRSYDTLGSARFTNNSVEMFDMDGSMLMRLPIENAEIREALRAQLSGTVKLVS